MKPMNLIPIFTCIILSCSDTGTSPKDRDFNLKLNYGVNARNELNTFDNTYTKDLITAGTITVPFVLSENELQQIRMKMVEIGFFSYPDTFIAATIDSMICSQTPYGTYVFEVKDKESLKKLYWEDGIVSENAEAAKLRELTLLIQDIIQSKPEYKRLPPAQGGYL